MKIQTKYRPNHDQVENFHEMECTGDGGGGGGQSEDKRVHVSKILLISLFLFRQ